MARIFYALEWPTDKLKTSEKFKIWLWDARWLRYLTYRKMHRLMVVLGVYRYEKSCNYVLGVKQNES